MSTQNLKPVAQVPWTLQVAHDLVNGWTAIRSGHRENAPLE